jgi:hypothetical protein
MIDGIAQRAASGSMSCLTMSANQQENSTLARIEHSTRRTSIVLPLAAQRQQHARMWSPLAYLECKRNAPRLRDIDVHHERPDHNTCDTCHRAPQKHKHEEPKERPAGEAVVVDQHEQGRCAKPRTDACEHWKGAFPPVVEPLTNDACDERAEEAARAKGHDYKGCHALAHALPL